MKKPSIRFAGSVAITILFTLSVASAQRIPKPGGFNLFSKNQDVQLGKEAAAEIRKQVTLVNNKELQAYIEGIGKRLAAAPEAQAYPYTFQVVQDEAINAFALPGGPTFVNTGLILAAENEAQLAGVMAHEISHVALRHGTKQASKAQLLNLGVMLGGGAIGGGSMLGQLAQLGIGLGANSVLLKYSRGAETDADLLGAHIMARAGYNPIEAARFFEKLEAETGKRSGVEQFFSSHPNPGNRSNRIEQELPYMPKGPYNGDTGQLARIQSIIKGLPPPPKKPTEGATTPAPPSGGPPPPVARPSDRLVSYRGSGFEVAYPENWQVYGERNAASITLAPEGGIVQLQGGTAIARGVIAQQVSLQRQVDLANDTQALIENMRQSNPSMQASGRRARQLKVAGQEALMTTLYSDSPYGGVKEIDTLVTVARPNGLYFMLFIAPQNEYRQHQAAFDKILRSVRF